MSVILLILGFVLAIEGADLLVTGASALARRLHVSDLVVGLTVVAFGTSLPELSVNIAASIKGSSEIAITNVLGSNVANIFLILGISSIIFPLAVTKGTVWKEIPLSFMAAMVMGILASDHLIDGKDNSCLTRIDGLILLCFFIIFIYYSTGIAKETPPMIEAKGAKTHGLTKSALYIFAGLALLVIGGKLIVEGAISVAAMLNIRESVIGATIVAVGTSIPELATSAVAAHRKNPDIAVGNVIGSNIFNIFFILGLSAIIKPLPVQSNDPLYVGAALLASAILFVCMFTGKRRILDRWEGVLLIMGYGLYLYLAASWG
ncbi:MAG TPA: calcium/sodium antiporter [Candidatus Binatia bacterium]|nr:MAG: sodium:proton exchanger [Planctomycetes bacterium RBG_16_55_9]HJX11196.1 calcium/sodium antiporter [Candidatus Binatia bacterium]